MRDETIVCLGLIGMEAVALIMKVDGAYLLPVAAICSGMMGFAVGKARCAPKA
jgi:hypothetical protein